MKQIFLKVKNFLVLSMVLNLFACKVLNGSESLYDSIMSAKVVASYSDSNTIDDFDTITLGAIEQYDDRQREKQGIEWLILYRDNEKALLQSKYIIALEPYTYEWKCPTYERYLNSDSYEEYNEVGEWVNSQFNNYKLEFNENSESYKRQKQWYDNRGDYYKENVPFVPRNDSDAGKSPFIYDWLDDTFINEIFNENEQKVVMPINVIEYNHDREEIIKNRKLTLMTFEDSEKYYGKISGGGYHYYNEKATTSTINNKIRTKATKAVDSFVKNYDSGILYQKGGASTNVYLISDKYYLNTKRTNDEGYIQGAHDAVIGINYRGKYEDLTYHWTFSSTSNLFGGGNSEDSIGIAGVRPCMWIDLNKAKNFKNSDNIEKYADSLVERNDIKSYDVDDKNVIFIKTVDEYNVDETIENFDTVRFGRFNNRYYGWLSDSPSDIELEWIPLEKTDNYILLISKYVLVTEPYNKDGSRSNFENSSLYEYLNGELVDGIFNGADKNKLVRLNSFNDTMFILDEDMIKKYFSNSSGEYCPKKAATKTMPSSHLKVNGSKYEHNWNNFNAEYLIDSKGDFDALVKYVDACGGINNYGTLLDAYKYGIRPAIYLDLHPESSKESVKIIDRKTKELRNDWSIMYKWSRASISESKRKYENAIKAKGKKKASESEIKIENNYTSLDESVFFGRYEQDGNLENGVEDIEWNIVKREDGKVLLLSKYIIESEIISDNQHVPIYDETVIRNKLVGEYYDKFFNDEEKEIIVQRDLNNLDCPLKKYGKNRTYNSDDKMFLLSLEEIRKYFGDTNKDLEKLKTKATYYVTDVKDVRRKINDIDVANSFWLRSPGINDGFASSQPTLDALLGIVPSFTTIEGDVNNTWACVDGNGIVNYAPSYIELDNSIRGSYYYNKTNFTLKTLAGVRPAIWVNEKKLKEHNKNHKINKYVYEDKRYKKNVFDIKDIDKVKCLSEYSSGYSYNDFDTVRFGKYAYDKNSNEKEDIEWFVLDKKDDKITLISKYIIDEMVMWDEELPEGYYTCIDAENTKCFKWLNSDFLNQSFSESEKAKILMSSNNMKKGHYCYDENKDYIYDRDVKSKVFLLNKNYIDKHFHLLIYIQ